MAGEIELAYGTTGRTLYAVVRSTTGTVWNTAGSAFEAFNAANWADYDVALAEQGASGYYVGDFPAGIVTAGVYNVEARDRAGGSPAVTDPPAGAGSLEWTGSAVASLGGGVNVVQVDGAALNPHTTGWFPAEANVIAINSLSPAAVVLSANVVQVNGDAGAADNLEAMLDGTGGVTLTATFAGNLTGSVGSLSNAGVDALYTRQLTESYNADGAAPTVAQALHVIMQMLTEMSITGTTMTVKKLDGSTTALTLTLNDASTPTSVTRSG